MARKKIAFLSVARSDFGRLYPSLVAVQNAAELELCLLVSGNHSSEEFGNSLQEIKSSGLTVADTIELKSLSMVDRAAELQGALSKYLEKEQPDLFVILGDRYEILAAAQASFLCGVPIIHIGGGYQTAGAIDDQIRHAVSQLSTYHFVATDKCRKRVEQLLGHGENIILSGAPDLEVLNQVEVLERESFYKLCHLHIERSFVLVTVHPETLSTLADNKAYLHCFKQFLVEIEDQILITAPCADPGAALVFEMISSLQNCRSDVRFIPSLGTQKYVSAMKYAKMIIGNSSSGIIESASLGTPVLNVGNRQRGRESNKNVVNSPFEMMALRQAYGTLQTLEFKKMCRQIDNIYGDGHFSGLFLKFLKCL